MQHSSREATAKQHYIFVKLKILGFLSRPPQRNRRRGGAVRDTLGTETFEGRKFHDALQQMICSAKFSRRAATNDLQCKILQVYYAFTGLLFVPDWVDKLQNVDLNQEPQFEEPEQQQGESHQEEQFKTQELCCIIRKAFFSAPIFL